MRDRYDILAASDPEFVEYPSSDELEVIAKQDPILAAELGGLAMLDEVEQ